MRAAQSMRPPATARQRETCTVLRVVGRNRSVAAGGAFGALSSFNCSSGSSGFTTAASGAGYAACRAFRMRYAVSGSEGGTIFLLWLDQAGPSERPRPEPGLAEASPR
jgi:hypothetical protein